MLQASALTTTTGEAGAAMCGIQIGAAALEKIVASSSGGAAGATELACGIQVGATELDKILASSSGGAASATELACGIQVGATE